MNVIVLYSIMINLEGEIASEKKIKLFYLHCFKEHLNLSISVSVNGNLHFSVDFGLLFLIICAHVEQCSYYSLAIRCQSVLHTAENLDMFCSR